MNAVWRAIVDYIEKNLIPGESVLYKTRLHWIVMIWPLIAGVLLGGIGLVFCVGGHEASGKGLSYPGMIIVGVLLLIAAVVLVGMGFIRQNSTGEWRSQTSVYLSRQGLSVERASKCSCQRSKASVSMSRASVECLALEA